MNNYLVTAEDIDGNMHLQRVQANNEEDAKYLFYKVTNPKLKYHRIVSVALIHRKFQTSEE